MLTFLLSANLRAFRTQSNTVQDDGSEGYKFTCMVLLHERKFTAKPSRSSASAAHKKRALTSTSFANVHLQHGHYNSANCPVHSPVNHDVLDQEIR